MPSGLATFVPSRQQVLYRNRPHAFAKFADPEESLIDLLLPPIHLRHNASDPTPVTRNNECFASLHIIEELRKVNFCF
jgi:hypothetical protein